MRAGLQSQCFHLTWVSTGGGGIVGKRLALSSLIVRPRTARQRDTGAPQADSGPPPINTHNAPLGKAWRSYMKRSGSFCSEERQQQAEAWEERHCAAASSGSRVWTAAGVQESALALVIISGEDVERENPQGGGGKGREAVILQAQSEPKWSRGLMQCNSTPSRRSTRHPGHRAGLLPNRLLNPFGVCVRCVCTECVYAAPLALIRSSPH
ncbi:hypothetical protein NQZ68_004189 [Dissostichus eleginoides]|nr:hypothetical protein NQZ68_004189 [Dissostichus eleginoides]